MSNSTYKRKVLKWHVGTKETGRYASFQHRAWPSADDQNGNAAVMLSCTESYSARLAQNTGDADIVVRIADWSNTNSATPDPKKAAFGWRKLVNTFKSVKEAKAAAEAIVLQHPEWMKAVPVEPKTE